MRSVKKLAPFVLFVALACATASSPAAAPAPSHPPVETGTFRAPDLFELVRLNPTIHLDVRYATTNNFAKRAVYKEARAFLQRPAAEAVVRAHHALAAQGYGIVVFDGYRPWSVTKHFWEIVTQQDRDRGFVANPAKGSKHNRGCAVDLSLYWLATGAEAPMPSTYDEFSDRASPKYAGGIGGAPRPARPPARHDGEGRFRGRSGGVVALQLQGLAQLSDPRRPVREDRKSEIESTLRSAKSGPSRRPFPVIV